MTRVLCTAALLLLSASATANPHEDQARTLLDQIASARSTADRKAAAGKLAELSPMPVKRLAEHLARERNSSDAERRGLLKSVGADVPDARGKFATPRRQTDSQQRKADEFDWLARVAGLPADTPALGDVMADIAAIRALAASRDAAAGKVILDFAFGPVGVVYRDECGRYLRKMSPWSLPALIRGSEARDSSLRRYATYQLERLDREDPNKALRYAGSEQLILEILRAFSDVGYREAVYPVLKMVDDDNPRIRDAARKTWVEFATGKPPRMSPKARIQMPGGKLSPKPVPLWLNHRELADIEIRRLLEKIKGKPPAETATLEEMTEELFAHYDAELDRTLGGVIDGALEKAAAGALAEAAEMLDQVLAQQPDHRRRPEMAGIYFEYARALENKTEWDAASMAFAKSHSLDPEGKRGKQALAQHHYTRGKALEARGEDASAEFARALDVEVETEAGSDRRWMLYAGAGGGVAGLLLLALGIAIRRR